MTKARHCIIWIDRLSMASVPKIFNTAHRFHGTDVYFLEASSIAVAATKCASIAGLVSISKVQKFAYSLGDMWLGGQPLAIKIQLDLSSIGDDAYKLIKDTHMYKKVSRTLPEPQLEVFFKQLIDEETRRIARLSAIVKWHKEQKTERPGSYVILFPKNNFASSLIKIMADEAVKFISYRNPGLKNMLRRRLGHLLRFKEKLVYTMTMRATKKSGPSSDTWSMKKSLIAAHYSHGEIDSKKRSDLFWFPCSGIAPDKVVVYFNRISQKGNLKKIFENINNLGMKWVGRNMGSSNGKWQKHGCPTALAVGKKLVSQLASLRSQVGTTSLDRWIFMNTAILLEEVRSCMILFESWNIKILINIGVQHKDFVAESIALGYLGGFRIGVQRTRLGLPEGQPFLRYNPNHIFFVWGKEVIRHKGTSRAIEKIIISGYPFDAVFDNDTSRENLRGILSGGKARFVIALFDGGMGRDTVNSETIMSKFYSKFLEWLIEDEEVAIVLKEKRPKLPHELNDIRDLLSRAEETGRYIRTDNPFGRFPSDVSRYADMAVGLNLTTAVMEAVMTGCRGVYCNFAKSYNHYIYEWGHEKLIFDDIDRLIAALKRYKADRSSEPGLGDWSRHLDEIEPFRDGRGGERIGNYVRWLLEGFDEGLGRRSAGERANKLYVDKWGIDKILSNNVTGRESGPVPAEREVEV